MPDDVTFHDSSPAPRAPSGRRLRVAHVCTVDLSLRYLLLNQLKFLSAQGYDVTAVSSAGPDVPFLQEQGLRHCAVRMTRTFSPLQDARALLELSALFRRERFDIVHTHNPKPGLIGQLAARMAGVPVVVNTLHGFYFHDHMPPKQRRFYVLMEQLAAAQSDAILSQNPEDAATAVREHICRADQIEVLGNGIDLGRFDRTTVDDDTRRRLRAELGLDEAAPVVGFVGRLVEEKGILELFEAFAAVRQVHPRARLLLIGPTDDEKADALRPSRAADYGIADACIFAGLRQDMPALLSLMDVFCLPSHREGFPRSPMEAAAMGVPVVATDIRGCRETVAVGETGVLVPRKDPTALGQALTALLTAVQDEAARERFRQRGRALALARFDERQVFATVDATYRRLVARRD